MHRSILAHVTALFLLLFLVVSPAARANPWVDLDAELDQRQHRPSPQTEASPSPPEQWAEAPDGDQIPESLAAPELPAAPEPPVPVPTPDEIARSVPRPPLPSELTPPLPMPRRVVPPVPMPEDVTHPLGLPPARWRCRQLAFGTHCWTSDPQLRRPAARPAAPSTRCGGRAESTAFALLNAERRKQGLPQLACDPAALAAARRHSADMCARRYFSHWSPEGASAKDRLRAAGARFDGAGENIAMGQLTAARAHLGWMSSPGHRQNILRPDYTRAAVGMVQCHGTLPYWTQVLLR